MKTKILSGMAGLAALLLAAGCVEENYTAYTENIITKVETGDATVDATSAVLSGTVLELSSAASSSYTVGAVYSTSQDAVSGTKVSGTLSGDGSVSTALTGLTVGQTYYYCTFVTLQSKLTKYGEVKSFVTTDAEIATADAAVTDYTATLGGTVNIPSEDKVTKGIKVSLDEAAVKAGRLYEAESEDNSYSITVSGLVPGKTYYYVSYAKVNAEEKYGEVKSFSTAAQEVEFVDMGLSVEWATVNVGATKPEEVGGLYGFGDKTLFNVSTQAADYIDTDILSTEYDLATMYIPDAYTPSKAQMQELVDNTTAELTTENGVAGYRFTAANKNSIFLPLTGTRTGSEVSGADALAAYWTSSVDAADADHASALTATGGKATVTGANRYEGLAIRAVRTSSKGKAQPFDNSKLLYGDLEGEGKLRLELYNVWGSSKDDPCVDPATFSFSRSLAVTFSLSGVEFKEGAVRQYNAALSFSDSGWAVQYWGGTAKQDALVTGDGTYTVWMQASAATSGLAVFCIDIAGIANDIVDMSAVKAEVVSIVTDASISKICKAIPVDNTKVQFVNKDGDLVNGRIEIYNEYGGTKNDPGVNQADINFCGRMCITFTLSGIDGNLVEGAAKDYKADLSYAAASWSPSYWGGGIGTAQVTGDGTYTVYADMGDNVCDGAVVWTIELYNLWKDLVDSTKVTVKIDEVAVEPVKK